MMNNFDTAYNLINQDFSESELFDLLENGTDVEKQYAALTINNITTQKQASIILNNLTGCDGKIREAVAYKLNNLISSKDKTHKHLINDSAKIFAEATIDINANICRHIIDSILILKNNTIFIKEYLNNILNVLDQAFSTLETFDFRDKKYVINKQLFKIYWCLETINNLQDYIELEKLYQIVEKSLNIEEYTIREKAALIVANNPNFNNFVQKINLDDNYYVKNILVQ